MDPNSKDSSNNRNNNSNDKKRPKGNILLALVITVVVVLLGSVVYNTISNSRYTKATYSDFLTAIEENQVAEVELHADRILYLTKEEAEKPAAQQKACFTGLPVGGNTMELAEKLDAMGVKVNKKIVEDNSWIITVLVYALMIGAVFLMMNMLTKKLGSGEGMMGGFGKNNAKVYMEKQTGVTFKDVAGQD